MQRFHMGGARCAAFALCSAALTLAACGGGGGTSPFPHGSPTPRATATPQQLPTPQAQSQSATITPSTASSATAVLPSTGGIVASVAVPQLTSGSGALAVTVATGADATMSGARQTFARRRQSMPGGAYVVQVDFVPDHDMTFASQPGLSLDITQWVTAAGLNVSQAAQFLQSQSLYAGIVDNAGDFNIVGPLTVSATGSAVTVTYSGAANVLTLHANEHYTIGVHLGPITAATATPSPTPSPTPTTTPSATPTATPTPTPAASPFTTTEISIPGMLGRAQSIASGPDGNVWVAGVFSSDGRQAAGLARLSPAGSVKVFDSGLTDAVAVTAGSDGNMWYIGNSSNVIGRLNPSTGAVTEYPYPIAFNNYGVGGGLDIVAGPDGDLWFTTTAGIGKINPGTGAVTMLAAGVSPSATPCNITTGADGDVYVAGQFSSINGAPITGDGGILQITAGGSMTAYDYDDMNSGHGPLGIASGPNGDVWFASSTFVADFGPTIARYTSGYRAGAQFTCLASGPDGNVWVPDQTNDTLYRVSTAGVTAFSSGITTGAIPYDIIAGPDGNLWFTEAGLTSIGRFDLH